MIGHIVLIVFWWSEGREITHARPCCLQRVIGLDWVLWLTGEQGIFRKHGSESKQYICRVGMTLP
jgi:hypothetical protein